MTTDTALLQQALDALESCDIDFSSDYNQTFNADLVKIAKIAIKARLAQPEQYQTSSPRPMQRLTDAELADMILQDRFWVDKPEPVTMNFFWADFANAIMDAMIEKNR